jgi:hypothetical protein
MMSAMMKDEGGRRENYLFVPVSQFKVEQWLAR